MTPSARDLRQRQTFAEETLWSELRNRKLGGLKFRRQHPIGPFVVDFCCLERFLIVEVDGGIHDLIIEGDTERTRKFEANGFRVIRFRNDEVFRELGAVLRKILEAADMGS